jgi:hypothetical protein
MITKAALDRTLLFYFHKREQLAIIRFMSLLFR